MSRLGYTAMKHTRQVSTALELAKDLVAWDAAPEPDAVDEGMVCIECHDSMGLLDGRDPSALCNLCAQDAAYKLSHQLLAERDARGTLTREHAELLKQQEKRAEELLDLAWCRTHNVGIRFESNQTVTVWCNGIKRRRRLFTAACEALRVAMSRELR